LIYGIRVKDKFGDNGLTGLIIITLDKNFANIDSLLLSCRILGKEIEFEFVKYILKKLKEKGIQQVKAEYIKTAKNAQVENFYDKIDFAVTEVSAEHKKYELNLKDKEFNISSKITMEDLCEKE